jgi:predicted TIM-barrel fold metal-dependent hydrolase
MDAIQGIDGIHPVWVVDPPLTGGPSAASKVVETMLESGVRACRLRMRDLPPLEAVWADLLAVLEAHRVPCFLDFGTVSTVGSLTDSDVRGVAEIASFHPRLPLVLSHLMGGLGIHPALPYLLRQMQNLHLDTTGLMDYARALARDGYADRVLFATGAPFADPGLFVHGTQYDHELGEEAKRMICGDNLRVLLDAVQ